MGVGRGEKRKEGISPSALSRFASIFPLSPEKMPDTQARPESSRRVSSPFGRVGRAEAPIVGLPVEHSISFSRLC